MFMADLFFMTPEGAILARPASAVRAGEERVAARRLAALGVPIVRSVGGRGTFEGADAMWLDAQTVLIGRGLRTNDEGAAQVATALHAMGVETAQVDLPYGTMHLMGMLRIVDRDLAIAWPTRLAVRAVEALRVRGYRVEFLPDVREARDSHAFNIVTLGPRTILMPGGNPPTQRFYEELGVRCVAVPVDEARSGVLRASSSARGGCALQPLALRLGEGA
jgi:N-dimethylarginine dimethylaminohydrolase